MIIIPAGDFSLYDQMLDMAVALGVVPQRYRSIKDPLKRYFAMARGLQDLNEGVDVPALEMTKWVLILGNVPTSCVVHPEGAKVPV